MDLKDLFKPIKPKIKPQNENLYITAFTHRSYLNEHQEHKFPSNERLEFLGDAILQFLASEQLFLNYPSLPEGKMTNIRAAIVRTEALAEKSKKLGFGNFLFLSKGEEESGGRDREYILANTFEAFLGALYLDQGINICREFLQSNLFPKIPTVIKEHTYKDHKSAFQELTQAKFGVTPNYELLKEWGPDHDKRFRVGVYVNDQKYGEGEGDSKQKAEQGAAEEALEKLKGEVEK